MPNDLQARDQTTSTALDGRDWVQHQVDKIRPHLRELGVDDGRFRRIVLAELSRDAQTPSKGLMQALQHSPARFYGAVLLSAQLDLEPGPPTGLSWIIPYADHGTPSCRWQIGYKGVIDLAWRVGIDIAAGTVHPGDHFEVIEGTNPRIDHRPALAQEGEPIAWYAVARLPDGRTKHRVLNKDKVEKRRKAGKTKMVPGRPWHDWYDSMARKTAILALRSELPLSGQLKQALQADDQPADLPAGIRLDGPGDPALQRPDDSDARSGEETSASTPAERETINVHGRLVDAESGEVLAQGDVTEQPPDDQDDDAAGPAPPAMADGAGAPTEGEAQGAPATDRQMIAIAHLASQRSLDDHDLCQLILDRFGVQASTVEEAIAGLDETQAGDLIAQLQGTPDDEEPPA